MKVIAETMDMNVITCGKAIDQEKQTELLGTPNTEGRKDSGDGRWARVSIITREPLTSHNSGHLTLTMDHLA